MSCVAPPRQHVGAFQHRIGQTMDRLIEGRRTDHGPAAERLAQGAGNRLVHALRINGAHALIGAGTVLEPSDVARVKEANGKLIVAPNFDADVVRAAKIAGLEALPGVMTPSEGFAALKAGADALKLFPAEIIPPVVFKAWRAVFPANTLLLAVGGIGVENIATYRDAGASGYGIGSALYKPGRPAAEIGPLARALVAAAKT